MEDWEPDAAFRRNADACMQIVKQHESVFSAVARQGFSDARLSSLALSLDSTDNDGDNDTTCTCYWKTTTILQVFAFILGHHDYEE